MRVISYGGGVQSTALLVLAVAGELGRVDAALFANVGDDAEHPDTLRFVREVAIPFGRAGGVPVIHLQHAGRDGTWETLMRRLLRGSRSIPIPVRMPDTGAPGTRNCTQTFKVNVLAKWLKARGVSTRHPAEVAIGFSWDEAHRVGKADRNPWQTPIYPLLDRRLTRADCARLIARAGLPVPPKSSCFFCPFHKPSTWATMRRDRPELFERSVHLEQLLNERRAALGRDPVYFTRFGKPLSLAIGVQLQTEFDFGTGPGAESCDEGYCWT